MFLIDFKWVRIFESAADKLEVKYNVQSYPNYFSVNVYVLVVVFRQQISKKTTILSETVGFLKIFVELQWISA